MTDVIIRDADRHEADAVVQLLGDLNEHERVARPDAATQARLINDGFGSAPRFHTLVAALGDEIVGCAVYFETYCSFLARPVLLLDAMFVKPKMRGRHLGSALFYMLAKTARERGCPRMEWSVYGFNTLAVEFYERMGAVPVFEWGPNRTRDWRVFRLEGQPLTEAAGRAKSRV